MIEKENNIEIDELVADEVIDPQKRDYSLIKILTSNNGIAVIGTIIGVITLYFLYQQNNLFQIQNRLIEKQNLRIEQQAQLTEASRRASQMFIMGEVLSDINMELESSNNTKRILSNTLVGRIISLSRAMKPYRYLENDTLTKYQSSPERGQLLITLIESKIDSIFLTEKLLKKCDFSYADLKGVDFTYSNLSEVELSNANLSYADLSYSYLKGAKFHSSNLEKTGLNDCDLTGANFSNANLTSADIHNSRLNGAHLHSANLSSAHLHNSNLSKSNLVFANLSEAEIINTDFTSSNMIGTIFIDSEYNFTDSKSLDKVIVKRSDWFEYLDSLKIKKTNKLRELYTLKKENYNGAGDIVWVLHRKN